MKRKGFTLVELLVVIAIIALLMGILMPALARVRQMAYRMVCGTNLSGLGKSIMVYTADNDEMFPRAAKEWATTGSLAEWYAPRYGEAIKSNASTVTSTWYLLVKYADAIPKQFVCRGDAGSKVFKLADFMIYSIDITDMTQGWDFGGCTTGLEPEVSPGGYCSYAFHNPFPGALGLGSPLRAISNPGCPVAADRNPHFDRNTTTYLEGVDDDEDVPEWDDTTNVQKPGIQDPDKTLNSAAHQREGQNVLFLDGHVTFEKTVNVGVENDNIYKNWALDIPDTAPPDPITDDIFVPSRKERQLGSVPLGQITPGGANHVAWAEEDSYLVNETMAKVTGCSSKQP